MNKVDDLIGSKVERLLIVDVVKENGVIFYLCECECGNEKKIRKADITRKDKRKVKSCGCLMIESTKKSFTKHGLSVSRFYITWANMKRRICDKNNISYKNYGGRGIEVCDEWHEFINFKNDMYDSYLKHVEEYGEKQTTIERIDPNGNYEPSNCAWATDLVQKNNQRRHKKFKATNIETGECFVYSSKSIFARDHKIIRQHISKVLDKERNHTGGFYFEYIE